MWGSLRADPEPPPVVPEPEVAARPAEAGEIPAMAQKLYDNAVANGWYGSVFYARGPLLHGSTGAATRVVDSVSVRLAWQGAREMQRVAAVWVDGDFDTAFVWIAGQTRFECGSPVVQAHVQGSQDAAVSAVRKGRCPGCGKTVARTRTFTASPSNEARTQTEVWRAAADAAKAWQPTKKDEVFRHEECTTTEGMRT